MSDWLWVACGGAVGSVLRYGLVTTVQRWAGMAWPLGTWGANLVGSFLIGWISQLIFTRDFMTPQGRLFVVVGLLGGFTTFSAFSLETLRLAQEGAWFLAASYVVLSVAGCLLGVWAGFHLSSAWAG